MVKPMVLYGTPEDASALNAHDAGTEIPPVMFVAES